ncbi:MAG: pentapeptide repeat-containing protein [Armatimonadota bacterium]
MSIQIRHRVTGAVLLTVEAESLAGLELEAEDPAEINLNGADLAGADLSGVCFERVSLAGADLGGVNLSDSTLLHVTINEANLQGANLAGCTLTFADVMRANLRGANLVAAILCHVALDGTDMRDVDARAARFGDIRMIGTDITGLKYGPRSKWDGIEFLKNDQFPQPNRAIYTEISPDEFLTPDREMQLSIEEASAWSIFDWDSEETDKPNKPVASGPRPEKKKTKRFSSAVQNVVAVRRQNGSIGQRLRQRPS